LSDIEVLRISHPPLNVLSVRDGVVATLDAALRAAKQSATVRAVVIAGSGSHFCAGADIADFDEDPQRLNAIRALMNLIESFPKPVVIAIDWLRQGTTA
jgi:3-hydroxyacyl-CoA dehydrogenase